MEIILNFYASLPSRIAEKIDKETHTINVDDGTNVRELLEHLRIPLYEVGLVFLNSVQPKPDQRLKDGDRLSILPIVAGG